MKQQSPALEFIILIPSQPVFASYFLLLRAQLRIKKCQLYKYLASSNPQSTALDSVDLFPDVVVEKMLYHLLCYFMLTWSNRLNKTEIPLLTNIRKPDENLDVRFEQIGVVCLLPVVILFLFVECANWYHEL